MLLLLLCMSVVVSHGSESITVFKHLWACAMAYTSLSVVSNRFSPMV
jgi:hypothetical protein